MLPSPGKGRYVGLLKECSIMSSALLSTQFSLKWSGEAMCQTCSWSMIQPAFLTAGFVTLGRAISGAIEIQRMTVNSDIE